MKLGNSTFILSIFFFFFYYLSLFAEDKILSTPLINLNELKPSFEETDNLADDVIDNNSIKNKKKILPKNNLSNAKFIGLDKITAKTSDIIINLGETKRFGPLEIKVLKCGKISSENKNDSVAYLQVKDLSSKDNNQVFLFNGWSFVSSPTLKSMDHPIYDLWVTSCENI